MFVSYSRLDRLYHDELMAEFAAAGLEHVAWSDARVRPGARWRPELAQAIDERRGAVLLISDRFLTSPFIRDVELPRLLSGGFVIPVFVDAVDLRPGSELLELQGINDLDDPVSGMDPAERAEAWRSVVVEVAERLGEAARPPGASPLLPPEDPMTPWMSVVEGLQRVDSTTSPDDLAMVARSALAVDGLAVMSSDGTWTRFSATDLTHEEIADCRDAVAEACEVGLWEGSNGSTFRRGAMVKGIGPRGDLSLLLVPVGAGGSLVPDVGVLVRRSVEWFPAALGVMASPILSAMQAEGAVRHVEANTIDALRREFGFVPDRLYLRRRFLFSRQLEDVTVFFEPIVELDLNHPEIVGFEALARDANGVLPRSVFGVARQWGKRLMAELDEHMVGVAVDTFAAQHQGRTGWPWELSVNVNPTSLVRDTYIETLRELLHEGRMPGRKLVLEIAEGQDLPSAGRVVDLRDGQPTSFREHLAALSSELHLSFAIDDFGTGFASLTRLVELHLRHVKLAREVITQADAELEIGYVAQRLRRITDPPRIVAEGVEPAGPGAVDVGMLHAAGVRFLQGYRFSRGGPNLEEVAAEAMEELERTCTALAAATR